MLRSARILGSGGHFPTDMRETSCLLLRGDDEAALLIDAGTGLRRLVTDARLLDGVAELDLVLTHFHPDHIIGLTWLGELGIRVRVWGPGVALYDRPTEEVLAPLFADPIFPAGLSELADGIGEVGLGDTRVGTFELRTRAQERHPNPTLGLRFGDQLVWCTDTEAEPATAEFARGADVLCHDAWSTRPSAGHTTATEAGALATEAGARRLVLIHVPPAEAHDALLAEAAAEHGDVCLARDGLELLAP